MDRISDSDSEDAGSIPAGATIHVYCLSNMTNREIYVGISNDVERRLAEHNKGRNRYTKAFVPWTVIFKEPHSNYRAARVREKYFKSAAGKKYLHKMIDVSSLSESQIVKTT